MLKTFKKIRANVSFILFMLKALVFGKKKTDRGICVYDALNEDIAFTESGFLNFGYWEKENKNLNLACQRLCEKVEEKATLSSAEKILDVGFGFATQDLFWIKKTKGKIWGVNSSFFQTKKAKQKVLQAKLEDRIILQTACAEHLPFEDCFFDTVIALESAFHFNTREDFFKEAKRVLKKGGKLILADILANKNLTKKEKVLWYLFDKAFYVPKANRISIDEYQKQLKDLGFTIALEEVTDKVLEPFLRYGKSQVKGFVLKALIYLIAFLMKRSNPFIYVIVSAVYQGEKLEEAQ